MRPRDPAHPSRSFSLRDALDARLEFIAARYGESPRYLVIDPLTWLAVNAALDTHALHIRPARAHNEVAGMIVVVIQTDGIPLLQVVGTNDAEAEKHLRGARDNAPKAPERSEA